ncbi:uncharacterized protein LOC110451291 [Mizuhopecten yessoensis]|nr:uncharacterized protein LOC110451291 [Mizuhopecten yessoensis]
MVTNPLSPHSNDQSNYGGPQGGSINYGSPQGNSNSSPFNVKQGFSSSTSSMGFGGSRSPGGNPASQQGSSLGLTLSRQDPSHQGGASYNMPYSHLRGRRTSYGLNSLLPRRSTNPFNTSRQNRRLYF